MLLFASHGYDAYGVEGSQTALKACAKAREGYEGREEYSVRDQAAGRGGVRFLHGDFFDDGWWEEIFKGEEKEGFDLIYDYTVCSRLSLSLSRSLLCNLCRNLRLEGEWADD